MINWRDRKPVGDMEWWLWPVLNRRSENGKRWVLYQQVSERRVRRWYIESPIFMGEN